MNDDCTQCREWEICPFHPKDDTSEVELRVTLNGCPMSDYEAPTVRSPGIVRVSSVDGETVLTYDNGQLVNEEPIEAYTDWGMGCLGCMWARADVCEGECELCDEFRCWKCGKGHPGR